MSLWSYQAPPELSDEQYARWQKLLEERSGICFWQHKSILQKGLYWRMRELGCEDYEQYYEQVSQVPEGIVEWSILVDRISVKETSFFRQQESFDVVRRFLRKRLESAQAVKAASDNKVNSGYNLDLWSVGCSTGEEAYSLAMVANDIVDYVPATVFLGVVATDISKSALAVGRRACYSARKVEALPGRMKDRYFKRVGPDEYQILPTLQQRVCFVHGNIVELDKTPPMAMDVIFCQNVLVYFKRLRQQQILDALAQRLKPGGMLVIGPGEVPSWQHPQMQRTTDENVQAYIRSAG